MASAILFSFKRKKKGFIEVHQVTRLRVQKENKGFCFSNFSTSIKLLLCHSLVRSVILFTVHNKAKRKKKGFMPWSAALPNRFSGFLSNAVAQCQIHF